MANIRFQSELIGRHRANIGPTQGQDRANIGQDRANIGQHRANIRPKIGPGA